MLIPFVPLEDRKRSARLKRKVPVRVPPTPPGPPLAVLDVLTLDPPSPAIVIWRFDGDATLNGAPLTGLQVEIEGVWRDPIGVQQFEVDSLYVIYNAQTNLNGMAYRIVATPTGIVQAGDIVLPQSGTVMFP